jgi:hypothetical protein
MRRYNPSLIVHVSTDPTHASTLGWSVWLQLKKFVLENERQKHKPFLASVALTLVARVEEMRSLCPNKEFSFIRCMPTRVFVWTKRTSLLLLQLVSTRRMPKKAYVFAVDAFVLSPRLNDQPMSSN